MKSKQGRDKKRGIALNLVLSEITNLKKKLSGLIKSQLLVRDGNKGDIGEKGEKGIDAINVTKAAVENNILSLWFDGVRRKVGEITTLKGDNGREGEKGNPGRDAVPAKNGKDGKPGRDGKDGEPGLSIIGKSGSQGKPGKDGVSITKASLENNTLFLWFDGVRKKVGELVLPKTMAPFRPGDTGGGIGITPEKFGFPWHILRKEGFKIENRRQVIIHDTLKLQGSLKLEGSAQLIIRN